MLTIAEIARAIRERRASAVEIVSATLERIERLDGAVGAFAAVDGERARRRARELDAELARGHWRGPLHGVPLAYKDLFVIRGLPNGCGTGIPDYWTDAPECTVARRLSEAGAVTVGKLTMTELAMGTFGVNAARGTPRNPRAPGRIPGGSSSGCAAAVAAGLVPAALGTDTGGSIRIPAACCGVVGLKPTYGRVSRAGVMPLAPSLDHVGLMALTAGDLAPLLHAVAGHDPADPCSRDEPVPDFAALAAASVRGLAVAVPENGYFRDLDPTVASALERVARALERAGASVRSLLLPDPGPMIEATAIVVRAEAAATHAARSAAFQPFTRARLQSGAAIPAERYLQAREACRTQRRQFLGEVFDKTDAVLAPIIPGPPLTVAEATAGSVEDVMARMARFARFARIVNGLGVPALALPAGVSPSGLPLAVQLVGRPFEEVVLLRLGAAVERAGLSPGTTPR